MIVDVEIAFSRLIDTDLMEFCIECNFCVTVQTIVDGLYLMD